MPVIELTEQAGIKAIDWFEKKSHTNEQPKVSFIQHDGNFRDFYFMVDDEPLFFLKGPNPDSLRNAKSMEDISDMYRLHCSRNHVKILEQAGLKESEEPDQGAETPTP